jgi:hypothetical protein
LITHKSKLPPGVSPRSGDYLAWLGGADDEVSQLSQAVAVPARDPVLRFYIQIASSDICGYDNMFLLVNGTAIGKIELCAENNTAGWEEVQVDLAAAAGKTVTLALRVETDSVESSSLLVDDVSLTGSEGGTTTPVVTTTVTVTVTPAPVPGNDIKNGDFEQGANGVWTEVSTSFGGTGSLILNQDALPAGLAPHSGNYAVWMGGAYDEESTLSQSVVLSSSIESLVYHYWIGSQDLCGYDRAEIRINGSAVKTHNLCMDENTNGWQQGTLDLKSFAGKTVDLAFYLTVDSSYNSNFLLDTIYLTKRAGGTVTPTTPVTTTATPEPAAFVLKANPGSKSIELGWTVPNHPSVVDYRVLRGTEQSFTAITSTAETFYSDVDDDVANDLQEGTRYCYKLEARSSTGAVLDTSNTACSQIGQLDVWMPEVVGKPNALVTIPVNIRNANGLRIASADIWLDVDTRVLSITHVSRSPLTVDYNWSYSVQPISGQRSRLRIAAIPADIGNPVQLFGEGILFQLTAQVVGTTGAKSPLDLIDYMAPPAGQGGSTISTLVSETQTAAVPLILGDGIFSVGDGNAGYVLGDVTGNGVVNADDAFQAMVLAAGKRTPTRQELSASDINGSGAIESVDAAMILYFAAHNNWPPLPVEGGARHTSAGARTVVAVTNGSGNLGGQATVTLQATDLLRFAAGDFVVLYDPAIASVRSVARAGIAEAGNFTLSSHEQTPGRLRIVLAGNQALNGNGALALVTFDLKPKAPVGDSTLRLAEAALYDLHGRHFVRNFSNNVVERRNSLLTVIGQTINQIYLPVLSR